MAQVIKRGERKYLIRVFLGRDETGKQNYHNETYRGTLSEARKRARDLESERDQGTLIRASTVTVEAYLVAWLDAIKGNIASRTHYDYGAYVRRYIEPAVGRVYLGDLTPLHVQQVYSDMKQRGLSARTVRYCHTIISQALGQGVKWGLLARNVAKLADVPKLIHRERKYLSPEQVQQFLAAADNDLWRPLWYLVIDSGMRPEEYLGLRWSATSLDRREVRVERVLVRSRIRGGGWTLEESKTPRSRRAIVISEETSEMLRRHHRGQNEKRLKAGKKYENNDLVFATDKGTPLSAQNLTRRHFKPILVAAGLQEIRLYDLRHSTATLLLALGENPKVVSERLGHSSSVLTLDVYSHVTATMQAEASRKLSEILFPGSRSH
jgi:integrase